ncbi:MAG: response regulator, partial [Oscillospiraceae bacterium]|nr:response regulator [Oscillospiraceae bacterium]
MKDTNILVADDDEDIVNSISIFLAAEGYGVFKAYNGRQALDIAVNNEIRLMLLDIMMP